MAAPPTSSADADARRQLVHGLWAGVVDGWAVHADQVAERGRSLDEVLLDRVGVQPGDQVLELACGPGATGLAAARRVGPEGTVVLSDVVPGMVDLAMRRAAAAGATNVRGAVLDLEDLAAPSGEHDVVLCRDGLMFALDPSRALSEIARVLRPGGRVGVAVWGDPSRNPWLALVFEAASAVLGHPVPPPGIPGPFALSDAHALRARFDAAGFADVHLEEVAVPLRSPTFEHHWRRTLALAGPLSLLLAQQPEATRGAIEDQARAAFEPFALDDGSYDLPGMGVVVSARRP